MPTKLDGVSVTVNGKSAYVCYISPTQVNILTPPDAMQGTVAVQVTNNGASSNAFSVQAQPISPSFFIFNGGPYVVARACRREPHRPGESLSRLDHSRNPGEIVVLYANGFGPTSTPVVSGSNTQSGTLPALPVVTIGGVAASVQFAGLISPGVVSVQRGGSAQRSERRQRAGGNLQWRRWLHRRRSSLSKAPRPRPRQSPFTWRRTATISGAARFPLPIPTNTDGPFATFDRARAFVQSIAKAGLTQVNVQFRAGNILPSRNRNVHRRRLGLGDHARSCTRIIRANRRSSAAACACRTGPTLSGNTWKTTLARIHAIFREPVLQRSAAAAAAAGRAATFGHVFPRTSARFI